MKLLKTSIFLFFAVSIFAQSKDYKVYLNQSSFDYLAESASELENIVIAIEDAYNNKDFSLASKTKGKLLSIVYKSSSASHGLCNAVELGIQTEETLDSRFVEMEDKDYGAIMEENKYQVSAQVSADEAKVLESTSSKLYEIKNQLSANGFDFHPDQDNTAANIELLKEFSKILSESAELYNTAKARS